MHQHQHSSEISPYLGICFSLVVGHEDNIVAVGDQFCNLFRILQPLDLGLFQYNERSQEVIAPEYSKNIMLLRSSMEKEKNIRIPLVIVKRLSDSCME